MDAETLIRRESARETDLAAAKERDTAGVQRLARAVLGRAIQDAVEDERVERWLHGKQAQVWISAAGIERKGQPRRGYGGR